MTTLEQLELDEREAWKSYVDYDEAGKPLSDKWNEIHHRLMHAKMKAEVLAELTSKTETE